MQPEAETTISNEQSTTAPPDSTTSGTLEKDMHLDVLQFHFRGLENFRAVCKESDQPFEEFRLQATRNQSESLFSQANFQTESQGYDPMNAEMLTKIAAEAEELALEAIQGGRGANVGKIFTALLKGFEKHRPDIYGEMVDLLSRETGTPTLSDKSFRELILFLNKQGIYYNERAMSPERQEGSSFSGPVFMPVIGHHSLEKAKESLIRFGFAETEFGLIDEALIVDQPQWDLGGTSEYGQVVLNAAFFRDTEFLSNPAILNSPAFKNLKREDEIEALAANELLHLVLVESLKFRQGNDEEEIVPFDGPAPEISGIHVRPETQLEAHELLSDSISIGVSQLDIARIIYSALILTKVSSASLGKYSAAHYKKFPGYDATHNFAINALMASFDIRKDSRFRHLLQMYGQQSESFFRASQNTTSVEEKQKIESEWKEVRKQFIQDVFGAMQIQDREFVAKQYQIYGETLLQYIRGSKFDL